MRLIDADELKEKIDEWIDIVGEVVIGKSMSYYAELQGCIDDCPTIEPVRHGKWIKEKPMIGGAYYRCSVCGNTENKHTAVKGHYCWFCGARME